MTSHIQNRNLNRALVLAGCTIVGAAVAKELRRPAAQRTWHGSIIGLPYDFRPPTPERLRTEFWDPQNNALFTPHAFGVGYGVNLARIVGRLCPPD